MKKPGAELCEQRPRRACWCEEEKRIGYLTAPRITPPITHFWAKM